MKTQERKSTPSKSKKYELEFMYICEREKLVKYIHQLINKIEDRIILLEAQQNNFK